MNLGEEEEEEEEGGDEELGTLLLSLSSLSISLSVPSYFSRRNVFILLIFVRKRKNFSRFANSALSSPLPMYFFLVEAKKGLRAAATSASEFLPERGEESHLVVNYGGKGGIQNHH